MLSGDLKVGDYFRRERPAHSNDEEWNRIIWRVTGFDTNEFFSVLVVNVLTGSHDAFARGAEVEIIDELELADYLLRGSLEG